MTFTEREQLKAQRRCFSCKQPGHMASDCLPKEYQEYADVFSKAAFNELPPHRPYDHFIQLEGDTNFIKYTPLQYMSDEELQEVKRYLDDNLKKGFIITSAVKITSPILFVRKPNRGLRFYVNY
jgi:hypothetical protein